MDSFDVFNGDADGLCALHQLRLVEPREATLITGVKRDIALLQRVPLVHGAVVTVLDISLERNQDALAALLESGAQVEYFDHHYSRHLGGAQRVWAVVGAFGDNMADVARHLAGSLALSEPQIAALQDLGECLNYNAYGDYEQDLFVAPADLYQQLRQHGDPFRFIAHAAALPVIRQGRQADLALARAIEPHTACDGGQLFLLPDAPWSRRVRGAFANALVQGAPEQAHAVLTADGQGTYVVSVRAPRKALQGAAELCRQFPGGGGRASAAGIDRLAQHQLADFVRAFAQTYCSGHMY